MILLNMPTLPILSAIPQLTETLSKYDEAILEAPPGAGKTTQVPLSLIDEPCLSGKKILMLEPRRLAAKTAAHRMANILGEKVGETVGYRIRLEQKTTKATRIEIITEGILARLLQTDPSLEDYGLVIFDEFHERNLDADLGLALTYEARSLFRDTEPLKLLVMSATLNGQEISKLLDNAPIISSMGRSYPIKTIYCGPPKKGEWLETNITKVILRAIEEQDGSILCFLPGVKEIKQVETSLAQALAHEPSAAKIQISPLYGDLKLENQQQAISPAPTGSRKVVLATSIAETSLTIEGVNIVIDCGQARSPKYDPNTSMTRLFTHQVSAAAATQRAGRAGRLAPGVCYRLWSEAQNALLAPFATPEIQQADLTGLALQLATWDIGQPNQLKWLSSPPEGAFSQAKQLLINLGAIDEAGKITNHGEQMAQFSAHPRISHMLIKATQLGLSVKASYIASLLTERDPFRETGADINTRLDWLSQPPLIHKGAWHRLQQQAKKYQQQCSLKEITIVRPEIQDEEQAGLLLAFAYPDRIAKQRSSGSSTYKMSNGRAASLFNVDRLAKYSWLTVAQTTGKSGHANDFIPLAAPLNPLLLEEYLTESLRYDEMIHWDEKTNRVIAEEQLRIGELTLSSRTLKDASSDVITQAIINYIRKQGIHILPWSEDLKRWRKRVTFLYNSSNQRTLTPNDIKWPDLSDSWLLDHMEDWLAPYLTQVTHVNHLKKIDLKNILTTMLPWPMPQQLNELAPERYKVPSGSRITIDYSHNPPILAVKLQEMFGCIETPIIAHNIALQLHLLSPAKRPLQVTQDLNSFWKNAYSDVQKDMKGRYPKHPWPDDPSKALPTAKTKKKMT